MTTVAAIDCGTNSIRLLIADATENGDLTELVREMDVVRLGQGIDRTGVIDAAAMRRALDACERYAGQCRAHGVDRIRFVATSATRDAGNAQDFVRGVRSAFAGFEVTPEVVSGGVEAELSFRGATRSLVAAGVPGPYAVVDIGGGSTEVVVGTSQVTAARSVDVGSVRITERHLAEDPPTAAEIAAATTDINAALDLVTQTVDLSEVRTVVGLAGSVTTVTAYVLGLSAYDRRAIHLSTATPQEHRDAADRLLHMARVDRAALGFMHPGRVDVIGAGALVWHEVLGRVLADARDPGSLQVVASEHDILDGIALSLL